MRHFTISEVKSWDRFYRGNFINSLSGFKSVSLIGTADKENNPNLAIFSNIVHLGADPALVGFINRPKEASPHTLANIEQTQCYTINHIHEDFVEKAHQTSAKYGIDESEFEKTGLTALWTADSKAPYVKESKVRYSLQLQEIIPIKKNNTFLVIGSIQDIYVPTIAVKSDGFVDLAGVGSLASLGLDGYYKTTAVNRYSYAKPGQQPFPLHG
ncbi:MAG: flavin reductase family protein [Sphingomonadales bacterium]